MLGFFKVLEKYSALRELLTNVDVRLQLVSCNLIGGVRKWIKYREVRDQISVKKVSFVRNRLPTPHVHFAWRDRTK